MFGERLFAGGYGGRYDTRYEQMFGVFCPYFARVVSGAGKARQGEEGAPAAQGGRSAIESLARPNLRGAPRQAQAR